MKNFSKSMIWIMTCVIMLTCISFLTADTGRYAVLLFGKTSNSSKHDPTNKDYVEHEIAPMYGVLLDSTKYAFQDSDIYVLNLDGDKADSASWHNLFVSSPENYLSADSTNLKSVFNDLNDKLNGNDDNLVFIFISGHQQLNPAGATNYYRLTEATISDADFARWLDNNLLNGAYNVKSKTKLVMVAGFCSPWFFYDPEIKDVCSYVSFSAADSHNVAPYYKIDAEVNKSFMTFYKNSASITSNHIDDLFNSAKSSFIEYYYDVRDPVWTDSLDKPFYGVKGGNWDTYWTLNGDLPPAIPQNLSITTSFGEHPYLTWTANQETDFKEYQIWKKKTDLNIWALRKTTSNTNYEDTSEDVEPRGGYTVYYKLKAVDLADHTSDYSSTVHTHVEFGLGMGKNIVKTSGAVPGKFNLQNNFPNPFNPVTNIQFDLPADSPVKLAVFNVRGQQVGELVNGNLSAGSYSAKFNAANLPSGVYIYQLTAGKFKAMKRMLLIK